MSQAVRWVDALSLDELWEGDIADVELDGEPVLLVHLPGGSIKAYQGLCPHQEVLLVDGEWDESTGRLLCSGHRWEFDLRTGAGVNPAGCQLYQYRVAVSDDKVRVGIAQDGLSHHHRASSSERAQS
jgi:toluene monooxygenase system ferredoxin subunit